MSCFFCCFFSWYRLMVNICHNHLLLVCNNNNNITKYTLIQNLVNLDQIVQEILTGDQMSKYDSSYIYNEPLHSLDVTTHWSTQVIQYRRYFWMHRQTDRQIDREITLRHPQILQNCKVSGKHIYRHCIIPDKKGYQLNIFLTSPQKIITDTHQSDSVWCF